MTDHLRVLHVSDIHLGLNHDYAQRNWDAVVAYVNETKPDLVINTGDTSFLDPDADDDLGHARGQMDRLQAPWLILPGNHDVGDTQPEPWIDIRVNDSRLDRYRRHFGDDFWARDLGQWRLMGLNSLVFGSKLAAEERQWHWLEAELGEAKGRPIALFLHKPMCNHHINEDSNTSMTIGEPARRRLNQALGDADVRLVGCGHVHEYRTWIADGRLMVSAPTTAFIHAVDQPPRNHGGMKRVGLVEYTFTPDAVSFRMVEPPGIEQLDAHVIRTDATRALIATMTERGKQEMAALVSAAE